MIRIYPSRLPGNPLETHHHGTTTLGAWLTANVDDYRSDIEQPISIDVDGAAVHPHEWYRHGITAESDVRIYPVPMGAGFAVYAAYAAFAIAAVTLVYALTLSTDTPGSQQQGDKIDLNSAKANGVKLGQPVRQIFGTMRVYPDYLVQPVSRFVDKRKMETSMALAVGVGSHSIANSSKKVGETPFAAFGSDVSDTIYAPGADLSADSRFDNWFIVGEVGGTDAGTAGLNTNSTASGGSAVIADALVLGGLSVALAGAVTEIPEIWDVGTIVQLEAPNNFVVTEVSGRNRIAGPLSDLAPFVGMNVTLSSNSDDYDLAVETYSPYVAPTPGVGGEPSSVISSAAPTTYDFSSSSETWVVSFQGIDRTISLAADYINMSGLVAEITSQLSGIGLVAQDSSGRLRIVEPSSPYQGGTISQSSAPVEVFGIGPTYVVGTASSGGTPESPAFITLSYPEGDPFIGLPLGQQRLAIGYRGNQYRITDIDGLTITVERLTDTATTDTGWAGFSARTVLDFLLASDATGINWLGPFTACPEGELVTQTEYDTYFPAGIGYYDDKGRVKYLGGLAIEVQWRDADLGGEWTSIRHVYGDATPDAIGYTNVVDHPYPMRPQFRLRREKSEEGGQVRDVAHWYGLRSRLSDRPDSYANITTMGLTIRTGDRLSAQSDRKINLIATRIFDDAANGSISGGALTVLGSLPVPPEQVDTVKLDELETAFWTPRNEQFNYSFESRSTARDVLQMIFRAGMGHLTLSGGLISAVREGIQALKGLIAPHVMTDELKVGFITPSANDFSGVDVEYRSSTTWAIETVRCRIPGLEAEKIETIKMDGVDRTVAYHYGMRKLRKYQGQRLSFDASTELDARCYEYLDHIVLADDIPGSTQSALIVGAEHMGGLAILTVTEPFNWDIPAPRCLIRRHDGTVTALATPTQIDEYTLSVPESVIDFDLITDLSIDPAIFLLADSSQVGYSALIQEISPGTDGATKLIALEYSDSFYADDDNNAPA